MKDLTGNTALNNCSNRLTYSHRRPQIDNFPHEKENIFTFIPHFLRTQFALLFFLIARNLKQIQSMFRQSWIIRPTF